jgi:hypothetical protein
MMKTTFKAFKDQGFLFACGGSKAPHKLIDGSMRFRHAVQHGVVSEIRCPYCRVSIAARVGLVGGK